MSKILVLCDGGFKSAAVAGLAVKEFGNDNVRLMFIDSGQMNGLKQRVSTHKLAEHYDVSYLALNHGANAGDLFKLTSHLFTALSYAAKTGMDRVYYGAAKPIKGFDFNYELTHTHLRNMQMMIKCARYENRRVSLPEPEAPFMLLNVIQVVKMSKIYQVPLDLCWNCETGNDVPCGQCSKCLTWEIAKRGLVRAKFSKGEK